MIYDKPFTNINDRLELLKLRKIDIIDPYSAEELIHLVSHHTLVNSYKDLFEVSKDVFKDNTSIEVLFVTHIIYSNFNSLLLKNILHIEKALKSRLSYYVAQKFGVETERTQLIKDLNGRFILPQNSSDYLHPFNYSGPNLFNIIEKITKQVRNPLDNSLTKYYLNTKNHTPPWIIANDLSLGKITNWYEILDGNLKSSVVKMFFNQTFNLTDIEMKELFIKTLGQLKEYRDLVAHGNKTTKIRFRNELPKAVILKITSYTSILSENEYLNGIGKNDIFGLIISSIVLLNQKTLVSLFFVELVTIIQLYEKTSFSGLSIYDVLCVPNDFQKRLFLFITYHYSITI